MFQNPLRAFLALSFLRRAEVRVTLKSGGTLPFSRNNRDHRFWDWYFRHPVPLQFTTDGLLQIEFAGRRLFLRPGSTDFVVFEEIFLQDDYGVRRSEKDYGTVMDLGANVGLFSCAVLPNAQRVIAVEAVCENHRQAVRNVTTNGGSAAAVLHAALAGESGKEIRIYYNARNTGGHSTSPTWTGCKDSEESEPSFETVETITLADLLDSQNVDTVDLLKCDIEGGEYDVFLSTGGETLSRIGEIVMEVHVSPAHPPELLRRLESHLQSAGFGVSLQRNVPQTDRVQSFLLTARKDEHCSQANFVIPGMATGGTSMSPQMYFSGPSFVFEFHTWSQVTS